MANKPDFTHHTGDDYERVVSEMPDICFNNDEHQLISDDEYKAYVKYLESKYKRRVLTLDVELLDNDEVGLNYRLEPIPFERIRRITGYLTGDVSSWNDAKSAELRDRTTNSLNNGMERL